MEVFPINTALLTTGRGAIARQTYNTLRTDSRLKAVVLSQRRKTSSKLHRVRAYGAWYTGQQLISHCMAHHSLSSQEMSVAGIQSRSWRCAQDGRSIIEWLSNLEIELVIVSGFQFILRPYFYESVPYCLNLHPSHLPDYRGPEPIAWGMLENRSTFGITLHRVDQGVDTGPIFAQRQISRPKLPLFALVERQLAGRVPEMIKKLFLAISLGSVQTQPNEGGGYLPAATLANRRIRDRERRLSL